MNRRCMSFRFVATVVVIGLCTLESCHAYFASKKTCLTQKLNDLKQNNSYPTCKIVKELFPEKPQDVEELLSKFVDVENVLIIGFTSLGASSFLQAVGITDVKVLYHDQLLFATVAASLEIVAGAVRLSIENFCKEKGGLNFTFV